MCSSCKTLMQNSILQLLSPVFEGLNIQYGILPEQNEKIKNERPVKVFALDKTAVSLN